MNPSPPLSISGLGCLSGLGTDLSSHRQAMHAGQLPFRALGELDGSPTAFSQLPAAWIEPRELLIHRKWSPASCAAIHVTREAIDQAGWSSAERREAVIFAGTSRGSVAGWLEPWPARRPFRLMAANNSLPSEPAAAVAHEFGIEGPWQVLSSGCCAGLDALGCAALWLRAGLAKRALVIATDLPLVGPILDAYAATGILATHLPGSPGSENSHGMIPAEGAAALCLEIGKGSGLPQLHNYLSVGEPSDPLGGARQSPALIRMIKEATATSGTPAATVPHTSGTRAQYHSEPAALRQALGEGSPVLPIKPWTGHTIGASGLLETVLLLSYLRHHTLPPAPPHFVPPTGLTLARGPIAPAATIIKLASAMGGKHSLVTLSAPV